MADSNPGPAAEKALGIDLFNETWSFLEKTSRTEGETEAMINACHASFHHWSRAADVTPTNLAIGLWQLSRVYAAAGVAERSEHYARLCFREAERAEPWVVGSAHEALARAASLRGDSAGRDRHLAEARKVADAQDDKETRDILLRDIESVP